jgi:L,D-peptidoglycan transpeptidase YkuD (ErfK/YbiS/YcfS/YnhG family)
LLPDARQRKNFFHRLIAVLLSSLVVLPVCDRVSAKAEPGESPSCQVTPIPDTVKRQMGGSSQALLVRNTKDSSVTVQVFALERQNDRWVCAFDAVDGVIGRKGFAPPGEKREGDGRTPSGIFPLMLTFGYEPSFPTRMPYWQITEDDLWVDDIHAEDYNRWVKRGMTRASSFEVMKREDGLYKCGIVVEYNTNPVVKGHGSAIFFHIWRGKGKPTAGCVALSEETLTRILRWLNPAASPLVILGTQAEREGVESWR